MKFFNKNRKLKLTLLFFLTATLMLFVGKLDSPGYLDFLKWELGLYATANAISKVSYGKNKS